MTATRLPVPHGGARAPSEWSAEDIAFAKSVLQTWHRMPRASGDLAALEVALGDLSCAELLVKLAALLA